MGETLQTPFSHTACLTMGRWSPCFADSFWANIILFDLCYDPNLLQCMYISLNIVFHKEYNGQSILSADNAWSSTVYFTQNPAQH